MIGLAWLKARLFGPGKQSPVAAESPKRIEYPTIAVTHPVMALHALDRFRTLMNAKQQEFRRLRVVLHACTIDRVSLCIDAGPPTFVFRDCGGSHGDPSITVCPPAFEASEHISVHAVSLVDDTGFAYSRHPRGLTGGLQSLMPGDKLYPTYTLSASVN